MECQLRQCQQLGEALRTSCAACPAAAAVSAVPPWPGWISRRPCASSRMQQQAGHTRRSTRRTAAARSTKRAAGNTAGGTGRTAGVGAAAVAAVAAAAGRTVGAERMCAAAAWRSVCWRPVGAGVCVLVSGLGHVAVQASMNRTGQNTECLGKGHPATRSCKHDTRPAVPEMWTSLDSSPPNNTATP